MIQAMQILQLPLLDLSERIEQELMENPFLEVAEPEASGAAEEGERTGAEADSGAESMLEMFERIERDHGDGSRARVASPEEGDRKYEAMLNAPEGAMTFAEAVLEQLGPLELSERERTVLEYVIWSLDERGYLTETPATLAAELTLEVQRTLGVDSEEGTAAAVIDDDEPEAVAPDDPAPEAAEDQVVTEDEVRDALERLRETVHPGLGALDLSECLLLQLPGAGLWNPFMRKLVQSHLGDVHANRLPQIAKSTGRDIEDVKAAIELLKRLDPSPGAGFGEVTAEVIHPEVMVELDDEDVIVRLDRERTPSLRLNPMYQTAEFRRMLKEGSKDEREWAKKRLENASWFIDAILQRESTLKRISVALFNRQKSFLERGKEALQTPAHAGDRGRGGRPHLDRLEGRGRQVRPDPAGDLPAEVLLHGWHDEVLGRGGEPDHDQGADQEDRRRRGSREAPLRRRDRQGARGRGRHQDRPPDGDEVPQGARDPILHPAQEVLSRSRSAGRMEPGSNPLPAARPRIWPRNGGHPRPSPLTSSAR